MREGEGLHRHLLREREFWAEISGHIAMRTERLEIGIVNMRIAGIDQHAARSILVQHLDMITLARGLQPQFRSEEHKSELQSIMRNSYAVFCLNNKIT